MLRGLVALFALGLTVAGCGRQSRVDPGAKGQVLHLGNGAEPKDVDPNTQEAEIEWVIDSALFEGLVDIANDGETVLPGVAERWDIAPDGKTYTFHLRADARWSDGSPVTADDFVYGFRRVFTPSIGSENNVYGYAIAGARAMNEGKSTWLGVHAVDARTLVVQLENPTPYILVILSGTPFEPVPRALVERFGGGTRPGTAWTRPGNIVSNGPFTLAAWRSNQELVAIRNPYYWDHAHVRLREVHFYPTDDLGAEERAFRSGQLDVTYQLPQSKIAAYRDRHDPALRITPQLCSVYLMFNVTAPPFADSRLRRALALAVDRDKIVPTVGQGAYTSGHSLTRPGTDHYSPPSFPDFNPALARQILAEAGYPGGHGFPAVTLRVATGPLRELAEAIQEAWRHNLGVKVEIQTQEQKTYFDALRTKDYSVSLMRFFYGVNAPETMLMVAQSESQWNWAGWKSPGFDQAYHDATAAPDEAARRGAFDRMERQIFTDSAYAPIAFLNQAHLVSPKLKGWRENAIYQIDWRELSIEP